MIFIILLLFMLAIKINGLGFEHDCLEDDSLFLKVLHYLTSKQRHHFEASDLVHWKPDCRVR